MKENIQKPAPLPTSQSKEPRNELSKKIDKPHQKLKLNDKERDDSDDSDVAYLSEIQITLI